MNNCIVAISFVCSSAENCKYKKVDISGNCIFSRYETLPECTCPAAMNEALDKHLHHNGNIIKGE